MSYYEDDIFEAINANDFNLLHVLCKPKLFRSLRSILNARYYNHDDVTPLMYAISKNNLEATRFLLDVGSDVNARDRRGNTAMHIAIDKKCQKEIVKLLLSYNFDLNTPNLWDETPLMLCLKNWPYNNDSYQIAEILLESGADPNTYKKPLENTVDYPETVLSLSIYSKYYDFAKLLLTYDVDVNYTLSNRYTALNYAIKMGNEDLVDTLISKGATVYNKDAYCEIPLIETTIKNNQYEIFKHLLRNADLNKKNDNNQTLFEVALKYLNFRVAKLLMEKGFDVALKKQNNLTYAEDAIKELSAMKLEYQVDPDYKALLNELRSSIILCTMDQSITPNVSIAEQFVLCPECITLYEYTDIACSHNNRYQNVSNQFIVECLNKSGALLKAIYSYDKKFDTNYAGEWNEFNEIDCSLLNEMIQIFIQLSWFGGRFIPLRALVTSIFDDFRAGLQFPIEEHLDWLVNILGGDRSCKSDNKIIYEYLENVNNGIKSISSKKPLKKFNLNILNTIQKEEGDKKESTCVKKIIKEFINVANFIINADSENLCDSKDVIHKIKLIVKDKKIIVSSNKKYYATPQEISDVVDKCSKLCDLVSTIAKPDVYVKPDIYYCPNCFKLSLALPDNLCDSCHKNIVKIQNEAFTKIDIASSEFLQFLININVPEKRLLLKEIHDDLIKMYVLFRLHLNIPDSMNELTICWHLLTTLCALSENVDFKEILFENILNKIDIPNALNSISSMVRIALNSVKESLLKIESDNNPLLKINLKSLQKSKLISEMFKFEYTSKLINILSLLKMNAANETNIELACNAVQELILNGDYEYSTKNTSVVKMQICSESEDIRKKTETDNSLEELLSELNSFVGIESVKKQMGSLVNYLKIQKLRKDRGFETSSISLHSVFYGSPGTGKTTIARLLGKLFKALGFVSNGHVIETDRSGMVAGYVGQTATKVDELIKKSLDGILFIDEAYTLKPEGADNDFGQEAIDILLKRMEDYRDRLIVIVAGYPEEMKRFLNSNPGLISRFNRYFIFEDYLPDQLLQIFIRYTNDSGYSLTKQAENVVKDLFEKYYLQKGKTFGNARLARNTFEKTIENMSDRLSKITDINNDILTVILEEDIPSYKNQVIVNENTLANATKILPKLVIDEQLLIEANKHLDLLIGMVDVKKCIHEHTSYIRLQILRQQKGLPVIPKSMHTVYTGNPGTGKTTIARIMGNIYKALGVLSKGHVVECDRSRLVAEYVGQTAVKTNAIIDTALNGVLFIDEAYTLVNSEDDSFGQEAIDTLLKRMEDDRSRLVVIVAGYTDEMKEFIDSNPGLQSRFTINIYFDDYTPEELYTIFSNTAKSYDLKIEEDLNRKLTEYFLNECKNKSKSFGNARSVRNIFEKIISMQAMRIAVNPTLPPDEIHWLRGVDFEYNNINSKHR